MNNPQEIENLIPIEGRKQKIVKMCAKSVNLLITKGKEVCIINDDYNCVHQEQNDDCGLYVSLKNAMVSIL
jgi:hypothetical protein